MTLNILLVEDNPADIRLMRETLSENKIYIDMAVVEDGVEAMRYLRREGPYLSAIRPDLMLLDLNIPKMDGLEVLKEVKQDPTLMTIPIVALTTSSAEEDILRSYNLHANCYVTKPVNLDQFIHIVKSIESFWLTVASLPPATASA